MVRTKQRDIGIILKNLDWIAVGISVILGIAVLNIYAYFLGANIPGALLSVLVVVASALLGLGFTEILFKRGRKASDVVTLVVWTIILFTALLLLSKYFPDITYNAIKFLRPAEEGVAETGRQMLASMVGMG